MTSRLPGLLAAVLCNPLHAAATFTPLGEYDGVPFSQPYAISDDGAVVVGYGLNLAFRWTEATGPVPLPGPAAGDAFLVARAVSADGGIVVGNGRPSGASALVSEIYVWSAATNGTVSLGDLAGGATRGLASAVSADGTVIAGTGVSTASSPMNEAYRWTSGTGLVGLGDLPGSAFDSQATAMSDDGLVVVGTSIVAAPGPQSRAYQQAFRWTQAGGMVGLGDLPGGEYWSVAWDTNADGSVVVGISAEADEDKAFRWTQAGGMVRLDGLPSYPRHVATAISGDGAIVGGNSGHLASQSAPAEYYAFLWTAALGAQDLKALLVSLGATGLDGWTLTGVSDISSDGHWLTGTGKNPSNVEQGWRAHVDSLIPDADGDGVADATDNCTQAANASQLDADGDGYGNMCDADLNQSGLTTSADFNLFRTCANQAAGSSALCAAADMNGSGLVTAADFTLLRARMNTAPGPSALHP